LPARRLCGDAVDLCDGRQPGAAGRRATWLAVPVSGLLLALAAGTPLATLGAAGYGWRVVFAALAVASLAVAVPNRLVWPAVREPVPTATRGEARALAARLVATVMWATALYGAYTYLGAGLVAAGADARTVAQVVVCYGFWRACGDLPRRPPRGPARQPRRDRAEPRRARRGTVRPRAAGRLGSIAAGARRPRFRSRLDPGADFLPAQQASLARDFPERRSAALAWNNSALFLGISLGAALGGVILDRAGYGAVLAAGAAVALAGCMLLPKLFAKSS